MILVTILSPFGVGLSFITVYVTAISLCFTGFVVLQMMYFTISSDSDSAALAPLRTDFSVLVTIVSPFGRMSP